MAIHSNILPCELPQIDEPGQLLSTGSQKGQTCLATKQQQCLNDKFRANQYTEALVI